MKSMEQRKKTHNNKSLLRVAQTAVACAAFALLAACGGGGGGGNSSSSSSTPPGGVALQVVSFGDSLSDVGTYSAIKLQFGGGQFTTNPGQVWAQDVANYYGDTLTPAVQGGFGVTPQATGGLGYAQGGARVINPQGLGWAPNNLAATTTPIVTQVANYLATHGTFNSNQLVLIQGGANDIFANTTALVTAIQTDIAGGMTPQAATLKEVSTTLGPAAQALVAQVATIVSKGATHVVLSNVPDIGQTPLGVATAQQQGAAAQQLLSGIVQTFNGLVGAYLQGANLPAGTVTLIDAATWQDKILASYQSNGFTVSNTATACNLAAMQASATSYAQQNPSVLLPGQTAAQFGAALASSLFCSPQTLTVAGADQTYMFADSVHPTTHLHALFAQYVEQQIAATGLGH
ncbi:SGNH/GDSL hydrolase family protein [Trinickia fusca]|uniref:Acylhydrolase n=1 Tax=Trinickia fusca TaxID=2419777 RepID=A0A494XLS8_9BURK|nr:SGNH/GDSL hydrolase family protein [Trinickia fusca]RKP49069.1 acylhydrolase [Trinickia fusca]